jgi:hypothetical protein
MIRDKWFLDGSPEHACACDGAIVADDTSSLARIHAS